MYYSIEEMLGIVDHPINRKPCLKLLKENESLFKTAPGSTHNHQAWHGGYWDHIQEIMNIAIVLYKNLYPLWIFNFTLGEALLVVFLHDLEKPWAFESGPDGEQRRKIGFRTKFNCHNFRMKKIEKYGIQLNTSQLNAIKYVEGELNDYSSKKRVMNELAAFCHMCDLASARIRHNHPFEKNDPWPGAERLKKLNQNKNA